MFPIPPILPAAARAPRFAAGLLAALSLMAAASPDAWAWQAYDGFAYPAGAGIAGQDGGAGWGAAWATGAAAGLATNVAGSLQFTDGAGRSLQVSGGSLVVGNPAGATATTATPNRPLPVNLSGGVGGTPGPGTVTWISFLYQRMNFAPAPYLRQANLGLFEGASGERMAVGGPNTSETVANVLSVWGNGGEHGGANPFQAAAYPITAGSTYLVLLKVVADGGPAADTAYAWFNWPDLLAEPDPATADIVQNEVNLSLVNTLRFQAGNLNANGSNAVFRVDELRVGSTFADVAPSTSDAAAPVINIQPAGLAVTEGDAAMFGVGAGGEPPLSYQWVMVPDIPIPGATNAVLELVAVGPEDAGGYVVVVSNPHGAVTSAVATLTVLPPAAPAITAHPEDRIAIAGEPVTLAVTATGQAPLAFQWRRDGTALPGRTDATLVLAAVTGGDAGDYTVAVTNSLGAVTSSVATLTVVDVGPPGLPAFPGADGAGRLATGGRGGLVYHVTKLDRDLTDAGAGTLRYGLTDANFPAGMPRTIVFDVAGVFWLGRFDGENGYDNGWDASSRYNLPSRVTIAGQSAPGPVIVMGGVTKIGGDNVIVRNVTFAPGYGMRGFHEPPAPPTPGAFPDAYVYDAIDVSGQTVLIDHCTTVYATDETISCNEDAASLTIQYCIIAQGQNYPQADAEASTIRYTGHALGSLLQAGSSAPISVLHNLYAHQKGRLPRIGTEPDQLTIPGVGARNDLRNNLFYNWLNTAGTGANGQPADANFLHNFYLAGPGGDDPVGGSNSNLVTRAGGTGIFNGDDPTLTRIHRAGNRKDTNRDGDPHDPLSADADFLAINPQAGAFDIDVGVTVPAAAALTNVLRHAGSRWWTRTYDFTVGNADAIGAAGIAAGLDERLIHETATGTGHIMAWADNPFDNDPDEGMEWRALLGLRADPLTGTAPFQHPPERDADGDGMPNDWEIAHGLDPEFADANGDFDDDGYTDLEEYLNELAAWPAPGLIAFTGEADSRYARLCNWRVTGEPVTFAGSGALPTSSPWQPSRYDTVRISNRTVIVDAPGQHAGSLQLTNSATLAISQGRLTAADAVDIEAGSALAVHDDGTLAAASLTNAGTLRLSGNATLALSGTLTNHGTIDAIAWHGSLPTNLVNSGTILGPDWILIGNTHASGDDILVTTHGYPGHDYQLQYADAVTSQSWLDAGPPSPGTNAPLTLTHPGGANAPNRFYRITVLPPHAE